MKLRGIIYSLIILLSLSTLQAQTKSAKVRALEKERRELQNSINKTDKAIKAVKQNKSKKNQHSKLLKQQIENRTRMLQVINDEIKSLNLSIDSLTRQIDGLVIDENKCKEEYARSVQMMQKKHHNVDQLLFIFSSESFDQALRRTRFLGQYANANERVAEQLKETRHTIERSRTELNNHKQQKDRLQQKRTSEKRQLEREKKNVDKQVSNLSSQQKKLERQLRQKQKQANRLDRKIQQQIAYEIAEAERRAKAKGGNRKAKSKGGYAMDAAELKLSNSFEGNKGRLPAPVNQRYTVDRPFGVQNHKTLSRVKTSNGGVDLSVPKGTSAVAVFDGVVTKVFVLSGYNTSVIVRHGNYLTVYSNLINVSVRSGMKVKRGQKLGTVAKDSYRDKHILQFQVWHERQKMNPMQWIR